MIFDHAQQLGKVEEWMPLAGWMPRLACGEHDQGLGVGAWVIGVHNGAQQLGRVMAWNWYEIKELRLKVDYWDGSWGPRQCQWREYNEGRTDAGASHGLWPLPHTGRAGTWTNTRVTRVWAGETGGVVTAGSSRRRQLWLRMNRAGRVLQAAGPENDMEEG